MEEIYLANRAQWRDWLERNHRSSAGVWLVFYRKGSGKPSPGYDEAVEEALRYGWVDSLIRKIDDERHARKMTPRTAASGWSASNIRRIEKLSKQGLMTEAGLRLVEEAKRAGRWQPVQPPRVPLNLPAEFERALAANPRARKHFDQLPPSQRKYFIGWVALAKRPETRQRRVEESIRLLEQGKRLGLK